MRLVLPCIAAALAAVFTPLSARAGEPERPDRPRPEMRAPRPNPEAMFQRLDANRDGVLTPAEIPEGAPERIKQLLKTEIEKHDGKLTLKSFAEAIASRRPGRGPERMDRAGPPPVARDGYDGMPDRPGQGRMAGKSPRWGGGPMDRAPWERGGQGGAAGPRPERHRPAPWAHWADGPQHRRARPDAYRPRACFEMYSWADAPRYRREGYAEFRYGERGFGPPRGEFHAGPPRDGFPYGGPQGPAWAGPRGGGWGDQRGFGPGGPIGARPGALPPQGPEARLAAIEKQKTMLKNLEAKIHGRLTALETQQEALRAAIEKAKDAPKD